MSKIVAFESGKLPAHINKFAGLFGGNKDLESRSGPSYDVLTIKGKVWRVVDHETRERVTLMDGDDNPLPSVRVHIVRANPNVSKVFYKEGYEEGSDSPPDCSSASGIKPDAMVKNPEAKSCAVCPHNVWGTGKEGKGRACSDSRRIAVAPEGNPDKIMLLRVPAASMKSLTNFGTTVAKRDLAYQMVVASIKFDPEASSPKLVFKPAAIASAEDLQIIADLQENEVVRAICGLADEEAEATPVEEDEEWGEEVEVATPKPKAKVRKAAPPVEEEDDEEEDEPAPAPKPKARKAAPTPPPVEEDEEEDEFEEEAAPAPKARKAAASTELPDDISSMLDGLGLDD